MTGVAGLKDLKKAQDAPDVEYFPYCRQEAVIAYLKEFFGEKPVEIRTPRIEIEAQGIEEIAKEHQNLVMS